MEILNPVTVNGNRFHWHGNEGSAEISDLGINHFERVYDDACDEGITIAGKREEVVFVVTKTDFNDDDVAGWHLESINRRTGRLDGRFKVLIIND
jgi:hypothetical protein